MCFLKKEVHRVSAGFGNVGLHGGPRLALFRVVQDLWLLSEPMGDGYAWARQAGGTFHRSEKLTSSKNTPQNLLAFLIGTGRGGRLSRARSGGGRAPSADGASGW